MVVALRVSEAVAAELQEIRVKAMIARPLRTIERAKSRLASELHNPQETTATSEALRLLDNVWLQVHGGE